MNGNNNKDKLTTKSNTISKKPSYKQFKDEKPLKNIDNNTSYSSSDGENNSTNEIKNNGSPLKKSESPKDNIKKNKTGKENNSNIVNKNIMPKSQESNINRELQNHSHYKIFTAPNEIINPNVNNLNSLAKVTKIKNEPLIDSKPKDIKAENKKIINSNYKYQTLNNNIYQNNNLNQLYKSYNLNLLKQNQNLNNNNISLINNNLKQQLNNNLMPRAKSISPFIPLTLGIGYDGYNSQNIFINSSQSRLTNIPVLNRYRLGNNINVNNERLTTGYKMLKGDNNILKYQNSFAINYPNTSNNNLIQNSNKYGETNINNNIRINQRNIPVDNYTKQITNNNYEAKPANSINNNLLNNNNNKININFKMPITRETILQNNRESIISSNNNIISNRNYPLNNVLNNIGNNNFISNTPNQDLTQINTTVSNQIFNQNKTTQEINLDNIFNNPSPINESSKNDLSLNDALNHLENNNQNSNLYINSIQKNINPQTLRLAQNNNNILEPQNDYLNQFFKNYTQPSQNQIFPQDSNYLTQKNDSKDEITLKDFGVLSRAGKDKQGMTKTNQDNYIAKRNINNLNNFNILGVLDGHGPQGHFISQFASQSILNKIINNPEIQMNTDIESIYNILTRNDYQIIKQAYISTDKQLVSSSYDCEESGTTCCLVIHIGNHLICANVGDSRGIVAYDEQNDNNLNFLSVMPLSIDYKPELEEEKARIIMSGGEIEQLKDSFGMNSGPYRVFAAGKDFPGLAMSRSIGDLIGKKIGIIAEPGIKEYNLGKNTKFVILCSDGVWEFLSNEKVRDVGRQFYLHSNATELCKELITLSVIEWQTQDSIIDDITALVAFF